MQRARGVCALVLVVSFTYFHFPLFPSEISMKPRPPNFGVHGGGNMACTTLVTSFTMELKVQNGCNIVQV